MFLDQFDHNEYKVYNEKFDLHDLSENNDHNEYHEQMV